MTTNPPQEVKEEGVIQSPNLIRESTPSYSPSKLKLFKAILKTNKTVILVIEFITVLLIIYNYKVASDLRNLDRKISEAAKELRDLKDTEKKLTVLSDKTTAFIKIKSEDPKVYPKIELTYKATPREVVINDLSLRGNVLKMSLTAPTATDFARFVDGYLSTKEVDKIILTGAEFNVLSQSYDFDVSVVIKNNL